MNVNVTVTVNPGRHQAIEDLLRKSSGIDAAALGHAVVARALRSRISACGLRDEDEYWQRLRQSTDELEQLTEALVVPETWFFRHPQACAALVEIVRNEWLPSHPAGCLRILSVPCSSGEEPYSIAMALLDAGLPPQRFKINAIDISARLIDRARRAIYGRNSFRGHDLAFRERHFTPVPEGLQLAEPVRERVEFDVGNLVADDFLPGAGLYDFVFCRNVLIYFDGETQQRVIRTLDRLLTADGVLFVGPAEAFVTRRAGFSPAKFPNAFACRKGVDKSARKVAPAPMAKPLKPVALPLRIAKPKPAARKPPVKTAVETAAETAAETPQSHLEEVRQLADAGRLDEAAAACEAHLAEHGPSAPALYLLALIFDGLGDPRAEETYRKVIYLEPDHVEALLHLALIARQKGDTAGELRLKERARRGGEAAKS